MFFSEQPFPLKAAGIAGLVVFHFFYGKHLPHTIE
jgi:hypothetical protein